MLKTILNLTFSLVSASPYALYLYGAIALAGVGIVGGIVYKIEDYGYHRAETKFVKIINDIHLAEQAEIERQKTIASKATAETDAKSKELDARSLDYQNQLKELKDAKADDLCTVTTNGIVNGVRPKHPNKPHSKTNSITPKL